MKISTCVVSALVTLCLVSFAQIPTYIPQSGLKGYWPFTCNANDFSGNGYHGNVVGATLTSDRFGNPSQAYSFNGTSNSISTAYTGILGGNPRAVSFWMRTSTNIAQPGVVWGGTNTGSRFDCGFNYMASGPTIDVASASITYFSPTSTTDNNWHHYVFQFSTAALNLVQIFMDGVLLTQTTYTMGPTTPLNTTNPSNVYFGAYPLGGGFYFSGQLDDICIWDRVLTFNEIQQLFTAPSTSASPSATLTVTSSPPMVCAGQSATLSTSGASTYTWVGFSTTSSSLVVTPAGATIYTVLGNCAASNTVAVGIAPAPVITISSSANPLCYSQVATLTAGGGVSYLWSVSTNGQAIFVSPSGNSTYSVTGTGANGCSASAVFTQSVMLCNGIDDLTNPDPKIIIYPNPTEDSFLITGINISSSIEIYDAIGNIISKRSAIDNSNIDLSAQSKGIYFVKISFENTSVIKKIIKE